MRTQSAQFSSSGVGPSKLGSAILRPGLPPRISPGTWIRRRVSRRRPGSSAVEYVEVLLGEDTGQRLEGGRVLQGIGVDLGNGGGLVVQHELDLS